MNESNYIWQRVEYDDISVQKLKKDLGIPKTIAQLLINRGVDDFSKARDYFRLNQDNFIDPFLMKGMTKAIERIHFALSNEQKVLVYGDYDVDGTCSVAMMAKFLKLFSDKIHIYQPDREEEGYGISMKSVEWVKDNNIELIIALDCGIKDFNSAERLKFNEVDLIICDHHVTGQNLPQAYAILNPKQVDCVYPFKDVCVRSYD